MKNAFIAIIALLAFAACSNEKTTAGFTPQQTPEAPRTLSPSVLKKTATDKYNQSCNVGNAGDDYILPCFGVNDMKLHLNAIVNWIATPPGTADETLAKDLALCKEIGFIEGRLYDLNVHSYTLLNGKPEDQKTAGFGAINALIAAKDAMTGFCDNDRYDNSEYRNQQALSQQADKMDAALNQLVTALGLNLKLAPLNVDGSEMPSWH